jgi:hypothetical protein
VTAMTKPTSPDPIEQIERVQKILGVAATLDDLEGGKREVLRLIADGADELEEIGNRRRIEMTAATPAAELDRKLDALDKREKEVARRVEIARAVLCQLETRISEQREADAAARCQDRYDEALELHREATRRVKAFLDKIADEAREVMRAYLESEAAIVAANKDRPPGCLPIMSIETERMGTLPPPRITVRRFQVFLNGREPVGEVGKVEAHPNSNGIWSVYLPSRSIQGDTIVPNCVVEDRVEIITEKYEPRPLEALVSALRVPEFSAPAPGLGRPERRVMPASEWAAMNGEAEVPLPRIAAE